MLISEIDYSVDEHKNKIRAERYMRVFKHSADRRDMPIFVPRICPRLPEPPITNKYKCFPVLAIYYSVDIVCRLEDRCPSGFGSPWICSPRSKSASVYGPPGPNPLADKDPRESIFASGFGRPFANLDLPTKVIILHFRTPGFVNE